MRNATAARPRGRPRIATVIGDPSGVGPEVIVKALASGEPQTRSRPILIGNLPALEEAAQVCGVTLRFRTVAAPEDAVDVGDEIAVIDPGLLARSAYTVGAVSEAAGRAVFGWLQAAIGYASGGRIDGFVLAPFESNALRLAGIAIDGPAFEPPGTYQLRISGPLRAVPLSEHVRLRDIPALVTTERVLHLIQTTHDHLERWGLPHPRIAVAGLNPHAMFEEDRTQIAPAVEAARSRGLRVSGPIAPDAVFRLALEGAFDAVCAMYHDQGQIAVKTAAFVGACTVFLGLPYVRIGIPHGTALDIAGTGRAQHATMLAAMNAAAGLAAGHGFVDERTADIERGSQR